MKETEELQMTGVDEKRVRTFTSVVRPTASASSRARSTSPCTSALRTLPQAVASRAAVPQMSTTHRTLRRFLSRTSPVFLPERQWPRLHPDSLRAVCANSANTSIAPSTHTRDAMPHQSTQKTSRRLRRLISMS
jgi:hypothetical protein